ncbi:MAG TPA: serine/threonine-protein kinase [Gemmatimonadales bacterium]|nr:serine/threonine-protein kinase [Gemmatimonadales bacterium]
MIDRRGTTLGKYRILDRLGEGGMGTVYHARDEMLDRDVAIKVLRPDLVRQTALVERFRTEAIALARLAHPRIATLYGLERDGDEFYMVMEFLRGETLEALVAREGRVSWRRAAEICAQVAEALDHAHDHGVVHRDIKPANIMIGPGGAAKVMDFGIARMAGSSRQTRHGHSVGTPAYMAPEQLRGEECDGRTDLYALGAVFYELVTGKVAFEADSDYKLMMQQLNDPPMPPSASNPDLPAIVDRTVLRAMSKQPADRYATAAAMRNALMEAAASVVTEAHTIRPAAPATRIADTPAPAPAPVPQARIVMPDPVGITAPVTAATDDAPTDTAGRGIWSDWRTWSTVAMLALAIGVVLRSRGPEIPAEPPVSPPSTEIGPPSTAPTTAPGVLEAGAQPRPAAPVGGGIIAPPPVVVPRPDPAPRNPPRTPPPAPTPAPTPERKPESPPPQKPAENDADRAAAAEREAQRAVTTAVRNWFQQGDAAGLTGSVDGQPADRLVREKRLGLGAPGTPSVNISGSEATATVTSEVEMRSAFGSSRRKSARFTLQLSQAGNGTWRVTRATVQG